ncbi:MAG: LON peptidase substrate-binding domain-containing protein [Burkholderiaceae bacterium]
MPADAPWLPLFPLHAVLFPDGLLALKIFETRYIDMIGACMKTAAPFGVVLIRSGQETGAAAEPESVGCLAHISDWDMRSDGILTVRARGGLRFRIIEQRTFSQRLEARIELLPEPAPQPVSAAHASCASTLRLVIEDIDRKGAADEPGYQSPFARPLRLDDAGWVADRWCEILPIPPRARQKLLELDDPGSRLEIVDRYLRQHRIL